MPISRDPTQIPLAVDLEVKDKANKQHNSTFGLIPSSYILNGIVEENKINNTKYVARRYGYDVVDAGPAGTFTEIKGFTYISTRDEFVWVYGSADYLYYNSIAYSLGVTATIYDMTFITSGGQDYIFIVGSVSSTSGTAGHAWVFNVNSTTLTKLVTGTHGFPDTTEYMARGAIILDTYAFVLTRSGKLYNSNVGDILTWTSTDFLRVSDEDVNTIYLAKHHDHILSCTTGEIRFYYDAGNPNGSPLSLRKDLTISLGIYSNRTAAGGTYFNSSYAITHDDEHVAFIGTSKFNDAITGSGDVPKRAEVYIIDNFRLKKISNSTIENLLSSAISTSDAFQLTLHNAHGRKFLIISPVLDNYGIFSTAYPGDLVYDFSTGYWYLWSLGARNDLGFRFSSGDFAVNSVTGVVYQSNEKFTQDEYNNGTSTTTVDFPHTIQTPQITLGTSKNKFCRETSLVGDYTAGQEDVEISWTDDNYQNFSTARNYDLQYHRKLTRCGMFRKRAWKIHQDSTTTGSRYPVRLSHIEIDVDGATVNTAD